MTEFSAAKESFARGISCLESGDFAGAERFFVETLELAPQSIPSWANLAVARYQQKKYGEAELASRKIIELDERNVDAYAMTAACCKEQSRGEEAVAVCRKIIEIDPSHLDAHANLGFALIRLGKYDDALASFGCAIQLRPDFADAWLGRGDALALLRRYDEALAAYDQALAIKPNLAAAWSGRGNVCSDLKRHDEAFAAYDEALALEPDLAEAWLGRGIVAAGLKRHDEALAAYDRALALKPTLAEAWLGRGNVLAVLQRYDQALAAYDKALAIKPDIAGIAGARLLVKIHCCDWSEFDHDCDRLIQSVRNNQEFAFPFVLFAVCSSAEEQMACARSIAANCYPAIPKPLWRGETYRHDKIRVGYVSADFHQHATAFLAAAMFECHDRKRFDVTAFSFGPNDGSKMRRRLESAFDRFLDLRGLDDERLASEIRQLEIDILVDLKGFTQDSRLGIFAHRPAPIQINYLGFPGTLGADYIDYIIADGMLIGDDERQYYSEKIVRLPHSYQPNDRSRVISTRNFTRTECGLPESAFVYCCFNNNYKITPVIFDCWMRILDRVGNGVLWLLEDHPAAAVNLRNEARRRGVDPRRIIFAKRLPLSEHLARHRLADLFLDTLPYNAHTTASDALWTGLPLLTQIGATFAGRVAASLLNAMALQELVAHSLEDYEAKAIELGRNGSKLSALKEKVAANRLATPLFDTQRFAQSIDAAYDAMYRRHQAALPPDHIDIRE